VTVPTLAELHRQMLLIRKLEESLLELFSRGELFGTTHTSIGQEAISVAVHAALDLERDVVYASHRCHGHFLSYGGTPEALLAEVMGRDSGVCRGVGGSQHLHFRNFSSSGVQGGIVPLAVGSALAERRRGTGAIAVVFLGDGTLGEGVVYEALNMASLWSAPVLFVVEDNAYAQTTPKELAIAGSITDRARAFGIDAGSVRSNDVEELIELFRARVSEVRRGGRPFFQVVETYRLAPHSKGDDFRAPEELARARAQEPLAISRARLPAAVADALDVETSRQVREAVDAARSAPWPTPEVLSALIPLEDSLVAGTTEPRLHAPGQPTVVQELNAALHSILETHSDVVLLGEDLLDPYGGAFKVTRGLSERFADRVLTTPISEAGFAGVANGMALRGLRPIVEIMFGDFLALAADQLANHAVKFAGMYGGRVRCPVTIRAPMGARRGYGPTHSQSLESMFLSVPGLEVVAASPFHPVGALLEAAVLRSDRPTLFVENKTMYGRLLRLPDEHGRVGELGARLGAGLYPTAHLSVDGFRSCDLVLVAHGAAAELCVSAAEHLMLEHEIAVDVLVPAQLSPLPVDDLVGPVAAAGRVVIVEEGPREFGWGAGVAAELAERAGARLGGRVRRLGARAHPIPVSRPLEEHVLPQLKDVVDAALSLF
jgi:2-oxoisovalerate dehydrogenase E1 component